MAEAGAKRKSDEEDNSPAAKRAKTEEALARFDVTLEELCSEAARIHTRMYEVQAQRDAAAAALRPAADASIPRVKCHCSPICCTDLNATVQCAVCRLMFCKPHMLGTRCMHVCAVYDLSYLPWERDTDAPAKLDSQDVHFVRTCRDARITKRGKDDDATDISLWTGVNEFYARLAAAPVLFVSPPLNVCEAVSPPSA